MSPLSKALIAYTTKLKIVLIAANSSCANIQSMIKFLYFFQQRELSIFYLLFCAKCKNSNLHTFVAPFRKLSDYFSPNAPISLFIVTSNSSSGGMDVSNTHWVSILRSYKINMVFEPLDGVFVLCNVVQ